MLDQFSLPSGLPISDEQRVRWFRFLNSTDEEIPPHACMWAFGGYAGEDGHIWRAEKPDSPQEQYQDVSELMFNGPESVPPQGSGATVPGHVGKVHFGRGTFDLPAQALMLKSELLSLGSDQTGLADGALGRVYVGPKARSWLLWGSGDAFEYVCPDWGAPDELLYSKSTSLVRVWVQRRAPNQLVYGVNTWNASALDVAPNGFVQLEVTSHTNVFGGGTDRLPGAGAYFFAFDGTFAFSDPAAPNNAALAIGANLGGANNLIFQAHRRPFKPGGVYETGSTIENIAFHGIANLKAADGTQEIMLQNLSAYTIRVYDARLTWFRLGPPRP